jgi:hypothetical protein
MNPPVGNYFPEKPAIQLVRNFLSRRTRKKHGTGVCQRIIKTRHPCVTTIIQKYAIAYPYET